MKKLLAILIFSFLITFLFSENWVGKAVVSPKKNGAITRSGEIYDTNKLTAACNGFKYGSEITVINFNTKKKVSVTINDRVDKKLDYFIMLSPKAASVIELGNDVELVIIQANFSDINSSEIISIKGLIYDEEINEIDRESLKGFPDIKWPEIDKVISEKDENKKITSYPDIDKTNNIPDKKKITNQIDNDEHGGYKYTYIDDNEYEIPKTETIKKPLLKKIKSNIDKDDSLYFYFIKDKEEKKVFTEKPETEDKTYPDKISKKYLLDKDIDQNVPSSKKKKYPDKKQTNIDFDTEEKNKDIKNTIIDIFPEEKKQQKPDKKKTYIILNNDTDKNYYISKKEKINEIKIFPKEDKSKKPDKYKRLSIINDDIDKNYYKNKIENINENKDTIKEVDKEIIVWNKFIPSGKIYIQISAASDKKEGERRYYLFKKVFGNTYAYLRNNKYIILIGPINKSEVNIILKQIRNFGYKDAFIINR